MTYTPHGVYAQGYTRAPLLDTKGRNLARVSQSHKVYLSSDRSLPLDSLKLESLVIADRPAVVNACAGLVLFARHIMIVDFTRRRFAYPS